MHGLGGDWKGTWRATSLPPDDEFGWPLWLGQDLHQAGVDSRVWSFDYDASPSAWAGHTLPLYDRAGQFLEEIDLTLAAETRLVFVCHSLGGLVVKRMLALAREKTGSKARIPDRTAAILFLGTPHQGSALARVLNLPVVGRVARATITVEELERGNPELRSLGETFCKQAAEVGWLVHQYAEGRDTLGARVVDEHSAFSGFGDRVVLDEDHFSLCKPASRAHPVHRRCLRMVESLEVGRDALPEGSGAKAPHVSMEALLMVRALIDDILNQGRSSGGSTYGG